MNYKITSKLRELEEFEHLSLIQGVDEASEEELAKRTFCHTVKDIARHMPNGDLFEPERAWDRWHDSLASFPSVEGNADTLVYQVGQYVVKCSRRATERAA